MAWWEPLGMRTAWPVLMSMASHDWFKSRRKVSSITRSCETDDNRFYRRRTVDISTMNEPVFVVRIRALPENRFHPRRQITFKLAQKNRREVFRNGASRLSKCRFVKPIRTNREKIHTGIGQSWIPPGMRRKEPSGCRRVESWF